jgi:predicted glycoside hydrolase/deacetylase ChbG (UPF0249 family)
MKRIIICADDFGLTQGVNDAIVKCYNVGSITLSTLIPNSQYFDEAVKLALHYQIPCGVHLTIASEFDICPLRPLLRETPANNNGFLFPNVFPYLQGRCEELIYQEFKEQILLVKKLGINPTHIDSHMHVFSLKVLQRLSDEFSLPCRDFVELKPGINETHFHLTTGGRTIKDKITALVNFIYSTDKHTNLIICHPTSNVNEMRSKISRKNKGRYEWLTVLRFQDMPCLLSNEVHSAIVKSDMMMSSSFI